jgi:hypothetical protein
MNQKNKPTSKQASKQKYYKTASTWVITYHGTTNETKQSKTQKRK